MPHTTARSPVNCLYWITRQTGWPCQSIAFINPEVGGLTPDPLLLSRYWARHWTPIAPDGQASGFQSSPTVIWTETRVKYSSLYQHQEKKSTHSVLLIIFWKWPQVSPFYRHTWNSACQCMWEGVYMTAMFYMFPLIWLSALVWCHAMNSLSVWLAVSIERHHFICTQTPFPLAF